MIKPLNILTDLTRLRDLHLQSIAQIWTDSDGIEQFISQCNKENLDFRTVDPSSFNGESFKDKYWVKMLLQLGPKNPEQTVEIKKIDDEGDYNTYLFWYEEIAPYYNELSGQYMLQPYLNNRITLKLPKKPVVPAGENESHFLTRAIASFIHESPWMFNEKLESQQSLTYKDSKASSLGDLSLVEDFFGYECALFIKAYGRYCVYFSAAYQEFYQQKYNKPLDCRSPVELIPTILDPKVPRPSYDLSDDASLYISFGAVMANLVSLLWTNEDMQKLFITKDLDSHKPGQTIKLLKDILEYDYPFHLDLLLFEDEDAIYSEDESGRGNWSWQYDEQTCNAFEEGLLNPDTRYDNPQLPLQGMELVVPVPPKVEAMEPVALNRYNIDDSAFPFTC